MFSCLLGPSIGSGSHNLWCPFFNRTSSVVIFGVLAQRWFWFGGPLVVVIACRYGSWITHHKILSLHWLRASLFILEIIVSSLLLSTIVAWLRIHRALFLQIESLAISLRWWALLQDWRRSFNFTLHCWDLVKFLCFQMQLLPFSDQFFLLIINNFQSILVKSVHSSMILRHFIVKIFKML